MTEELKNPYVNLPRASYISLPLVTLIYLFANVAYLAVLTPMAMEASNAIAVTFADRVLGMMWSMPLLVALSAFGGLSPHHDLIQDVFCGCKVRPFSSHVVPHQRQEIHPDTLLGVLDIVPKSWQDGTKETCKRRSPGDGKRFTVLHAGSKEGFGEVNWRLPWEDERQQLRDVDKRPTASLP